MCGIFGAISSNIVHDISQILIDGLRALEYRGYDSAGMALLNKGEIESLKSVGDINALQEAYDVVPVRGYAGIAHTRWATHGSVTTSNTHPIIVDNIAVVHNGVVENYLELLQELQEKYGYSRSSQTDTEVIAAMIYYEYLKSKNLIESVCETVKVLKGKLSFCVLSNENPDEIIAVRLGRNLSIGLGDSMNYISSDLLAFPEEVTQILHLEDGDIAMVTSKGYEIMNIFGESIDRSTEAYKYENYKSLHSGDQTFMYKEIREQQSIISSIINGVGNLTPIFDSVKDYTRVHIIGCGAAFYAGCVGKYLIERECNIPCGLDIASEFYMRKPVVDVETLYIFISQSGETADTIEALEYVHSRGAKTLGVVNRVPSHISRACDFVIPTNAGIERSVAATKTFTAQVLALTLLTKHISNQLQDFVDAFDPIILGITEKLEDQIKSVTNVIEDAARFLYIGRDVLYPICLEGALKIKEIGYIAAEAIAGGEIKHGPIALVDDKTPVIILAPYSQEQLFTKISSNIQEINARNGLIILITCAKGKEALSHLNIKHVIEMPEISADMLPIAYSIPLQLIAYHYALKMGYNIDKPRNLAKSVTVE